MILRLRGQNDLGTTFLDVMARYANSLRSAHSRLVVLYADDKVREQLQATGKATAIGDENIYASDEWLGATVKRAASEAQQWITAKGVAG